MNGVMSPFPRKFAWCGDYFIPRTTLLSLIKPYYVFDSIFVKFVGYNLKVDHLCGLVVRVPGYRSRRPGSIPGATRISE
jgi:hypothetical protein